MRIRFTHLAGFMMLALVMSFYSCASGPAPKSSAEAPKANDPYANVAHIDGATVQTVHLAPKVTGSYGNVILTGFDMSDTLKAEYPQALDQCKVSMLSYLQSKHAFQRVAEESEATYPANTILVSAKVVDMRIAGAAARIWGGALAGSSYMQIYIQLTDAATHAILQKRVIESHNNAFGAAWGASTDASLPMDMGRILGEYLYTVIPAQS